MAFFKSKSERNLDRAVRGITEYINLFQKAADAAEAELKGLSEFVSTKIDKYDAKIEKAYSKYMATEDKFNDKVVKLETEAERRKSELEAVAAQAKRAVENHAKIYLSGN